MYRFALTFEIVTPESAAHNDNTAAGYLARELTFREAVALFDDERGGRFVEADMDQLHAPRELRDQGRFDPRTNEQRSIALHIPANVTPASRRRIARVLHCEGV